MPTIVYLTYLCLNHIFVYLYNIHFHIILSSAGEALIKFNTFFLYKRNNENEIAFHVYNNFFNQK